MGSVSLDYIINPIISGTIININFWSNFESTYIKKKISFINGHKVQRHKT